MRPVGRQSRGQSHPKRNRRDRSNELDQPLDEVVDDAPVEPRQAPQEQANDEADGDAHKTDGQGNASSVQGAAQDIPTELVSPQKKDGADLFGVFDTEEMPVHPE